MSYIENIKRPFIWLLRFRHRRGYGVHSPFAFFVIKNLIYERLPYYSYSSLKSEVHEGTHNRYWFDEPPRLRRLLFRLANYIQPRNIVYANNELASVRYVCSACKTAKLNVVHLQDDVSDFGLPLFLYINCWRNPSEVKAFFNLYVNKVDDSSLIVIAGIGYTHDMHKLWEEMVKDERVGITFDLYDVGLMFFDHSKNKQHYIVNFNCVR